MRPQTFMSIFALVVGIALCVADDEFANAQQPPIKRTELLKTDLAGMEGKEMNIWMADLRQELKLANTTIRRPGS